MDKDMLTVDNSKNNDNLDNSNVNNKEAIERFVLDIIVSANRLKVYLRARLLDNDAVITENDIMQKLEEYQIAFGIKNDEIKQFCKKKDYSKEIVIAEGIAPIHDKDAYIEYNFKLDDSIQFREKDDGSVDFKNFDNIKTIQKDGLLCKKIPIDEGTDGKDVYGNDVLHNKSKDVELPTGKNTYVSDDKLSLFAAVDGCIHKKGRNVDVDNVYTVTNVDHSTGNINFLGTVIIKGDVKAGFTVKAKDDIVVKGMVEGAVLVSGRDVTISNGMNGRDVGSINALGNITSKYLENSNIVAGKSIYADAIINCNTEAAENVVLKGSRGAIIGGECKAGQIISAKNIGTKNNIQTKITIDLEKFLGIQNSQSRNKELKIKTSALIVEKQNEVEDINEKIRLLAPYISKSPANDKLYKLLILKKSKINKEVNDLKTQLVEQEDTSKRISDHKILCSGIIYTNTRIAIGWLKYTVRDDLSYSKLYNDGGEIQVTPLLPSDLDMEVR